MQLLIGYEGPLTPHSHPYLSPSPPHGTDMGHRKTKLALGWRPPCACWVGPTVPQWAAQDARGEPHRQFHPAVDLRQEGHTATVHRKSVVGGTSHFWAGRDAHFTEKNSCLLL